MTGIHEGIGWLGAVLFSMCAVPQVIKTWRTKKAEDLSWLFILFWLWGEIFTFTYIIIDNIQTGNFQLPLYLNYTFNTVLVLFLVYAKVFYKN